MAVMGGPMVVGWARCRACGRWGGLYARAICPDDSARGECPWCHHHNEFGADEIEDAPPAGEAREQP